MHSNSSLLTDVHNRIRAYTSAINDRAVFPTPAALDALSELDTPLPDDPTDPAQVLDMLDEIGSPATVATSGGRYFGFVTGGVLPAAQAAALLAAAWDQNGGLSVMSPIAAQLEQLALGWLVDLLQLPAGTGGGFVTGATMANFSALAAARHALLERQGWNVEADGLFGAPPLQVVVGDEVHASLLKALSMIGFGRARVIRVPVDGQGRMRADALPALNEHTILCIQAGNVNTGAFDPAADLCQAAQQAGAWVHVDGAFGLWALAAPARAHLAAGLEMADSWATDGHKWLNVPYDSGLVFIRRPEHLHASMAASAAYLMQDGPREPLHYTPEMSRRARGIEVWAALRSLGRQGLAHMIERNCQQAARFGQGLQAAGYEILNDVVLNQVLVSFGDAEKTQRVIQAIQQEGTCWCGSTVWQGRAAMRISVSSWATTDEDVERSLAAMVRVAREIVG
ncbi:MAG: aspartate aminotransferase family protein [Caldilineaceae bacterium]|nr:aspartate aminotransferase family protein [Caldilineaceae bacterium]